MLLSAQVSREEKYKAKLTIDAVVQRLGDTVAALVFEILGELQICAWLLKHAPALHTKMLHLRGSQRWCLRY